MKIKWLFGVFQLQIGTVYPQVKPTGHTEGNNCQREEGKKNGFLFHVLPSFMSTWSRRERLVPLHEDVDPGAEFHRITGCRFQAVHDCFVFVFHVLVIIYVSYQEREGLDH